MQDEFLCSCGEGMTLNNLMLYVLYLGLFTSASRQVYHLLQYAIVSEKVLPTMKTFLFKNKNTKNHLSFQLGKTSARCLLETFGGSFFECVHAG